MCSLSQLQKYFAQDGMSPVTGVCEPGEDRAGIILDFVNDHHVAHWIAIDDLNLTSSLPEGHFVWCPRGFQQAQFEQADRYLAIQVPDPDQGHVILHVGSQQK